MRQMMMAQMNASAGNPAAMGLSSQKGIASMTGAGGPLGHPASRPTQESFLEREQQLQAQKVQEMET